MLLFTLTTRLMDATRKYVIRNLYDAHPCKCVSITGLSDSPHIQKERKQRCLPCAGNEKSHSFTVKKSWTHNQTARFHAGGTVPIDNYCLPSNFELPQHLIWRLTDPKDPLNCQYTRPTRCSHEGPLATFSHPHNIKFQNLYFWNFNQFRDLKNPWPPKQFVLISLQVVFFQTG